MFAILWRMTEQRVKREVNQSSIRPNRGTALLSVPLFCYCRKYEREAEGSNELWPFGVNRKIKEVFSFSLMILHWQQKEKCEGGKNDVDEKSCAWKWQWWRCGVSKPASSYPLLFFVPEFSPSAYFRLTPPPPARTPTFIFVRLRNGITRDDIALYFHSLVYIDMICLLPPSSALFTTPSRPPILPSPSCHATHRH